MASAVKLLSGSEAPVGEEQVELDLAVDAAVTHAAASQTQLLRRVSEIAFDEIEGPIFVADAFAAKVADEERASGGTDDSAVPLGAAGDDLDGVG